MHHDVYIFDTSDGGEITEDLEVRDGLESSVYLSLFGGNSDDDGRKNNAFNWWGNLDELDQVKLYRNEAAYLIKTAPPTPQNLKRIEDAAKRDLAWVIDQEVSNTLRVQATMPGLNTVKLKVFLDGIDPIEFQSFWGDLPSKNIAPPSVIVNDSFTLTGTGLPNATLRMIKSDGSVIETPILPNGTWALDPYPLEHGEISTIYVVTLSGRTSRGVIVVGVGALLYDGAVYYDGSETYDGRKL